MTAEFKAALRTQETDLDGTLERFSGDEELYTRCLSDFLDDITMEQLCTAVKGRSWDDAFTAAHALKGLAGNLGFIPLFHDCAELVMLIRSGRVDEVIISFESMKKTYASITKIINRYCKCNADA